jgi:sugar lactone lactonase YvrE
VLVASDKGLVLARADGGGAEADEVLWRPAADALGGRLRFNDGKCDPVGRLLVGTMDSDEKAPLGVLYSVEHAGPGQPLRVRPLLRDVTVSNGLAWTPDGRTLFYIDSPRRRVQRFAYDPATGELSAHVAGPVLVDTAPLLPDAFPDGMAADADGHVWVAFWAAGCVCRFDGRSGALLRQVRFPTDNITSVAFASDALYVTSSAAHLPPAARAAQPLAGALFVLRSSGASAPPAVPFAIRP